MIKSVGGFMSRKRGIVVTIDGIFLDGIPDQKIFQRDIGQTSKAMPVSGYYGSFTATAIQVQVLKSADNSVVVDWTTLDAAPTGGHFSGTVTVPQGGAYYLKVRDSVLKAKTATLATSFFVGMVLIGYGQSNWLGHVGTSGSPPSANAQTKVYDGDTATWGTTISGGNGIRNLMNDLNTALSVPVGLVWGGQAGVGINALIPGGPYGLYETLAARLAAAGGDAEFICFHQGEGDGAGGYTTWQANLDTIHGALATATGRTKAQMPLLCSSLARHTTDDGSGSANWAAEMGVQRTVNSAYANMYYSHSNMDATLADGLHMDATSYGRSGKRYARSILKLLGSVSTAPPWFITGVSRQSTTVTRVTLAHSMGTDFTPTSGITGFEVSSDNWATSITPSSAARVDATHIDLTHSAVASNLSLLVRYQYGVSPDISGAVVDNSTLASPLNYSSPDTLTAAGSVSLPTPSYKGHVQTANQGSNLYRATNVPLGTADANRRVIFAITGANGTSAPTSITIGGIAVTTVRSDFPTPSSTNVVSWYTAIVPTGTTANVDIQFPGTIYFTPEVIAWTVDDTTLSSSTAVDAQRNGSSTAGTTLDVNLTTSAGGFILAVAATGTAASTLALSGTETFVERANYGIGGGKAVAADASNVAAATSASNVTVTENTSGTRLTVCAVSFR
ncbi:MAG: sialate O-acetylesterase [Hyphomicrobium sp.]|uniref:sialate O-acetylesterase n=1 Tax=Hyphomicrobium sp. TaxID=82 RepID=UPI0039E3E65E